MVAENKPEAPKRSFIARFFIFLFKAILLLAVLAAGGAIGALGASWVNVRNLVDQAQDIRLDGLQQEVEKQGQLAGRFSEMVGQSNAMTAELNSLNGGTATLAADLSSLSEQVAAQTALLEAHETQIATLTDAQTGILDDLSAAQTDVENLVETTAGLRRNLTTSAQSATGVGDAVSDLEAQISDLEASLGEIQATLTSTETVAAADEESTADSDEADAPAAAADVVSTASVDLTPVQILSQVARAKIHLLESDTDSAASAIESAIELTDAFADTAAEEQAESLATLADNLEVALANLEGKPAVSAIALDVAWDSLDELLTALSN